MRSKGRLLYIINHIDWFWSHRLPLALAAQREGWDVYVATAGASCDLKLKEYGFHAVDLPAGAFKIFQALRRAQIMIKPDVTHAITIKYAFLNGLACRTVRSKHIVHTIAGLGYLFSADSLKPKILRAFISPLLKFAFKAPHTKLIFQNSDDMSLMIERNYVRPEDCFLIRGSGVDVDQFTFTPEPGNITPLVLMPTRLVHEKGVSVFIDAAKILQDQGVNARFQIAGGVAEDNPRAISAQEMQKMINGSPVEWLGKVTDMPALLASATLIAYPSWYREGVPKVLLEAAAAGRAIVTTDHPGCREAVTDQVNGLLVPVKDARALANAIEKLLSDRERRERMGAAGRIRAETEFNVKNVVAQTLKLY